MSKTPGSVAAVFLMATATSLGGCGTMPSSTSDIPGITERMQEACPTLPEEALVGFVAAIATLREDEGLGEADALDAWVQSCEAIPPDGNFGGDMDVCAACLSVLVEEVYNE